MARYFFQAEWRGALVTDDFGEEFRTLDEAEAHAAVVAHELGRNCPYGIPVFVLSEAKYWRAAAQRAYVATMRFNFLNRDGL
jgi:hypothetical protein